MAQRSPRPVWMVKLIKYLAQYYTDGRLLVGNPEEDGDAANRYYVNTYGEWGLSGKYRTALTCICL